MNNIDEPLIVYWSPNNYIPAEESWALLYKDPISVASTIKNMKSPNAGNASIFACPAAQSSLKNLYSLNSCIENIVDIPKGILKGEGVDWDTSNGPIPLRADSKLNINIQRQTSLSGHVNILLNLGWLFISEEPLVAKLTAPYLPPVSPALGAILALGQFDIGRWFRPVHLEYHIPIETTTLIWKEDDPFCYMEFKTDREVVFKRFSMTPIVHHLQREASDSGNRYGKFTSLAKKYKMAEQSRIKDQLIIEIKKNLLP